MARRAQFAERIEELGLEMSRIGILRVNDSGHEETFVIHGNASSLPDSQRVRSRLHVNTGIAHVEASLGFGTESVERPLSFRVD